MPPARRSWWDGRIVLPVVLLVATTVYLIGSFRIAAPYEDQGVGAAFFPIVLSVVMYGALLVVLWQGLKEARGAPLERLRLVAPIKVLLLTAVYIALFQPVGYFIATTLYVYALFFVFEFGSRSHVKRLAAAIAIAIAFFLLFETAFGVRLPKIWGLI